MATNETLQPIWPEFPAEFHDMLPGSQHPETLDGCFCPVCAAELWSSMPKHDSSVPLEPFSCDPRHVLEVFRSNTRFLKQLSKELEGWKPREGYAVESMHVIAQRNGIPPDVASKVQSLLEWLEECIKSVKVTGNLPDVKQLGNITGDLLFGSYVSYDQPAYKWASKEELRDEDGTDLWGTSEVGGEFGDVVESTISLNSELLQMDKNVATSVLKLLSVMLHEQTHSYSDTYTCSGFCRESPAKTKLCSFLHAKTVHMFDTGVYQGKEELCSDTGGHGPIFYAIIRDITYIMGRILDFGLSEPSAGSTYSEVADEPPKGGDLLPNCICEIPCQHCCFPSKSEMQSMTIKEIISTPLYVGKMKDSNRAD
ncbi:hypothetical protein K491DRAFT_685525 [Lophiostoma macrostomum CBS 122681]|uniref:Uncharacterized protein n=1 Tax=Lophiostoma macrostomum CBS 122681 TaxID=1314788 RepID=A0A6A6SI54_9PLEO|nr:hypothetical protein K491DRAFT_685525 [Lophiostoma macrostomum CBS 122681]